MLLLTVGPEVSSESLPSGRELVVLAPHSSLASRELAKAYSTSLANRELGIGESIVCGIGDTVMCKFENSGQYYKCRIVPPGITQNGIAHVEWTFNRNYCGQAMMTLVRNLFNRSLVFGFDSSLLFQQF